MAKVILLFNNNPKAQQLQWQINFFIPENFFYNNLKP